MRPVRVVMELPMHRPRPVARPSSMMRWQNFSDWGGPMATNTNRPGWAATKSTAARTASASWMNPIGGLWWATRVRPNCPARSAIADLAGQFGLTRVAHHNPPMGFIHDADAVRAAVDFVAAHPGRFVFVAMGPPQSEKFCQRIIDDGRATGLGLCIGSSITTLTGRTPSAPRWMEDRGLVWLYRLAREPGRLWRRYLVRGLYGLGLGLIDSVAFRLGLKSARPRD